MNPETQNADPTLRPEAQADPAPDGAVPAEATTDDTERPPLIDHDSYQALQQELEQALAKAQENWDAYLSARAEVENVRKRSERELQNAHKFALEKFVNELLPVKDSLEMGIAAAAEVVDVNKLREGSELTLKMLTTAMDKFGVTEIDPLGEKFDPARHEAMAMQPSDQAAPNTVLHVVQKGYALNERLIRPAMVIVAQAAAGKNTAQNSPG